ncbi:hypothetical protein [Desulfonatronum thioautotrophicum]|uniref:hypothetical protein n=1 Tax=Desulfonatronum thioautotrophicum TaxID=617001 RepID=UPI00069A2649|nr:hypothetical protein [Desulfonatronum thioautotrophicum]
MTIADTHVHIYPHYDLHAFLVQACRNLDRCVSSTTSATAHPLPIRVLYLAESAGCDWYQQILNGQIPMPGDWSLRTARSASCLTVSHADHGELHIVPGRQIATEERLEVLGLAMSAPVPDGLPLPQALARIEAAGGTPVLPWAVGKWLFKRGRTLENLLRTTPPGRFLLGDSAMRPAPGPLPRLMRLARDLGFGLTAGSDPLPLPGEEQLVGSFALSTDTRFSPDTPADLLRELLRKQPSLTGSRIVGHRRSYGSVLLKTLQLQFTGKHRSPRES